MLTSNSLLVLLNKKITSISIMPLQHQAYIVKILFRNFKVLTQICPVFPALRYQIISNLLVEFRLHFRWNGLWQYTFIIFITSG